MSKARRHSTSAEILASTAGSNTWKTWAGRSHGSEEFELLDIFRGVKRKFNAKFVWGIPPAGTPCPICFCVPANKSEWHVTSACGHATCRDCLQAYAASLIRDTSHHGPLKCPVCPLPLRPKDAIRAISSSPELVHLWDAKIRDEVLRALPGYRHCPHCQHNSTNNNNNKNVRKEGSNNDAKPNAKTSKRRHSTNYSPLARNNDNYDSHRDDDTNTSLLMGGGFVTPECLAPINTQREQSALAWLDHPCMSQQALVIAYMAYTWLYSGVHSSSVFVNVIHTSVVPFWILRRMWLLARRIVAFEARKALFQPIPVECPCCSRQFILNAESELNATPITDEATQNWIGQNTRPCPRCSVPISKIEGCNHMQCTHCRARFCWACMRLSQKCQAFNCQNGAPYGNAGTSQDLVEGAEDGSILDRIDRIERESIRFDQRDWVTLALIVVSFIARETFVVQWLAKVVVGGFAFLFSSGTIFTLLLCFVLSNMVRNRQRGRFGLREVMDGTAVAGVAADLFDVDHAVEQRMIREAIRRSMVER